MPHETFDAAEEPSAANSGHVIVVGASAGGVEALQELVRELPVDLAAPMIMVLHIHPRSKSFLPEILSAAGLLAASHAVDGERMEAGHIYVAPPDHHLIIERHHIHLGIGPKENYQRVLRDIRHWISPQRTCTNYSTFGHLDNWPARPSESRKSRTASGASASWITSRLCRSGGENFAALANPFGPEVLLMS
ncbi:MAG TPA: chemotaxis protein CheB [Bryobacteraceae bacterium]|nr:chemotaxis protein CheB [Bryobacteraceae bacterium]